MFCMVSTNWTCAAALFLLISTASANTYFSEKPGSCQIIGDVDVYGIGIRLGFYFQFAAVVIYISMNRQEDVTSARDGFNAFSTALLINLFRNASTLAVEWYIVFLLVIIIPLVTSVYATSSIDNISDGSITFLVQWLLYAAFLGATPFLFFTAIDRGHKPGCEIKAFLFGDVYLYQKGWRITGKVLSIIAAGSLFISVPWAILDVVKWQMHSTTHSDSNLNSSAHNDRVVFRSIGALTYGTLAIAFAERTIVINGIDMSAGQITAAGQLIPLVIGIFIFTSALMTCVRAVAQETRTRERQRRRNRQAKNLVELGNRILVDTPIIDASDNLSPNTLKRFLGLFHK